MLVGEVDGLAIRQSNDRNDRNESRILQRLALKKRGRNVMTNILVAVVTLRPHATNIGLCLIVPSRARHPQRPGMHAPSPPPGGHPRHVVLPPPVPPPGVGAVAVTKTRRPRVRRAAGELPEWGALECGGREVRFPALVYLRVSITCTFKCQSMFQVVVVCT